MRILYFSNSFGTPTTTFIRNETEAFNKTDQIKYVCNFLYSAIKRPDYIEVIPFEETRIIKKIKWWLWSLDLYCDFKNTLFSKKLNSIINDFRPDIIHCHFGYEALMLLDNIDEFEKRKIIIHFHGYDATAMTRKNSYIKKLKYYLSKDNIHTISCNQYFIDKFKNEFHIPISNYFVLKYGIDTNYLFKPSEVFHYNSPYIIQVSSFAEKKGHEYTIQAFKKITTIDSYQNYKLILIGDGERKIELVNLVEQLKLQDKVVFLGILPPNEVAKYLSKATAFVHHSITDSTGDMEGIPNAIMEAMALNLPIISTIHSGIPELIQDGVNGYLVKEKDINHFASRMIDAIKKGSIPENRKKILTEYSLDLHNTLLSNYYKSWIG